MLALTSLSLAKSQRLDPAISENNPGAGRLDRFAFDQIQRVSKRPFSACREAGCFESNSTQHVLELDRIGDCVL
jgi:hypothetical protein